MKLTAAGMGGSPQSPSTYNNMSLKYRLQTITASSKYRPPQQLRLFDLEETEQNERKNVEFSQNCLITKPKKYGVIPSFVWNKIL